jgi:excisionase family DNA binding protein
METKLLKIEETAKMLGVGRSTAYEMIRREELPVVKMGRSVRVPVTALKRWMEERTENVPEVNGGEA